MIEIYEMLRIALERTMTLANSHGGPLRQEADFPHTLCDVLRGAVQAAPHNGIIHLQADGSETFQSYLELRDDAERVLAPSTGWVKTAGQSDFSTGADRRFSGRVLGLRPWGIYSCSHASIAPTYQTVTGTLTSPGKCVGDAGASGRTRW